MEKGLALQDILSGVYDYIATVEFSPQTRVYLLDHLGQVESVVPLSSYLYHKTNRSCITTGIACPLEGVRNCS